MLPEADERQAGLVVGVGGAMNSLPQRPKAPAVVFKDSYGFVVS